MTAEQWRPFVRRYLKRFADHPDFDDMAQEAVIRLWRSSARYRDLSPERQAKLYASVVWKATTEFLRSPQNRTCQYRRRGGRPLQTVSLEALAAEERLDGRYRFLGVTPDFVPALIERLQAERVLSSLILTPQQQIVLERMIVDGQSGEVVGAYLGRSANHVRQIAAQIRRQMRLATGVAEPRRGYRGVYRGPRRYGARLRIGEQKYYFAKWETAEEAAVVVDAAIIAFGVKGPLNLLPDSVRG